MKDKKSKRKMEGTQSDLAFEFDQLDLNHSDTARNEPPLQVFDKFFFNVLH